MSAFVLKFIALAAMLIDHIAYVFWLPDGSLMFMRLIGRLAFPIFAFQLAEGYAHTKNLYKYGFRLGVLAMVSQVPFFLMRNGLLSVRLGITAIYSSPYNIVFTLFLSLAAIYAFDKLRAFPRYETKTKIGAVLNTVFGQAVRLIPVLCIAYVGQSLGVEYGFLGVLLAVGFYAVRKERISSVIVLAVYVILYVLKSMPESLDRFAFYTCAIFAAVPIWFYKKELRGFKCKWLTYAFYPAHLLLLAIIKYLA
ncbi:MAG: TraX family protein [Clostridia bacterium]|nr:TraX family protein [Clostridia bacterium]